MYSKTCANSGEEKQQKSGRAGGLTPKTHTLMNNA